MNSGNKKVPKGLVALSSAAVIAVYGAGYARTRAAADKFAQQATERRPHIPADRGETGEPIAPLAPPAATVATATAAATAPVRREEPRERTEPARRVPAADAPAARVEEPAPAAAAPAAVTAIADAAGSETPAAAPPTPVPAPAPAPAPAAAQAPVPAPAPTPAQVLAAFKDGTYYGWGSCRHGDIQAAVTIEAGKITEARVERCLTRYSCNWVTPIFPRIVAKQGTTYDYVSGATESSDAFQDAVAQALRQAKP